MTTLIIDTKNKSAQKLLDYLKSLPYIKVIGPSYEIDDFNQETIEAIKEVEEGKGTVCEDFNDYLKKIEDV